MFLVSMADIIGSYERLPNDAVRAVAVAKRREYAQQPKPNVSLKNINAPWRSEISPAVARAELNKCQPVKQPPPDETFVSLVALKTNVWFKKAMPGKELPRQFKDNDEAQRTQWLFISMKCRTCHLYTGV